MGFRDREKKRIVPLKPKLFSAAACEQGEYKSSKRDFCLADTHSAENLHVSIRADAFAYFRERGISWHEGNGEGGCLPSNNLCCSQSACVNFWSPFLCHPTALASVLLHLGYSVDVVLPFVADQKLQNGQFSCVAFEWIGTRNYLGELTYGKRAKDDERSRGAHFTSADFAFRFKRTDGLVQIVLGEWKYTEYYSVGKSIQLSKSGTDRLERIYRQHLTRPDCQIRLPAGVAFEDLFYDPFDQMMRLQLLASAMEREHEDADVVSVLHVAPRANKQLMDQVTSPALGNILLGRNIHAIQEALVIKDHFKGIFTEDLLPVVLRHAPDKDWSDYMDLRYGSMAVIQE